MRQLKKIQLRLKSKNSRILRITNRKRANNLEYSTDTLLNYEFLVLIAAVLVGTIVVIAIFVNFFIPFKEERDYIKMEMERSFEEDEYRYWRRELKRLYLRSIPFIGRFLR